MISILKAAGAAVMLVAALGASSANAETAPGSIVFAYPSDNLALIPLYVAQDKGFFDRAGVKVEFTRVGAGNYYPALFSGEADVIGSNLSEPLVLKSRGKDVKALGMYGQNLATQFVFSKALAEKKGITEKSTLEEKVLALRGTTIAPTGKGASTDNQLQFLLAKYGLDYQRDLTVTYMKDGTAMLAALLAGQIDGFIHNAPWWQTAVKRGDAILYVDFSGGEVPETRGYVQYAMVTQPSTIEAKKVELEKFLQAVSQGVSFARDPANLDEITDIAIKHVSDGTTNRDDVRNLFEVILKNDMIPDSSVISEAGFMANKTFYNTIQRLSGLPELSYEYKDIVDTTLITEALENLKAANTDAK